MLFYEKYNSLLFYSTWLDVELLNFFSINFK